MIVFEIRFEDHTIYATRGDEMWNVQITDDMDEETKTIFLTDIEFGALQTLMATDEVPWAEQAYAVLAWIDWGTPDEPNKWRIIP